MGSFSYSARLDVKTKCRSLAQNRLCTNFAALLLGELFGNEKTQTATAILHMTFDIRLPKSFENLVDLLVPETDSRVADAKRKGNLFTRAPFRIACHIHILLALVIQNILSVKKARGPDKETPNRMEIFGSSDGFTNLIALVRRFINTCDYRKV